MSKRVVSPFEDYRELVKSLTLVESQGLNGLQAEIPISDNLKKHHPSSTANSNHFVASKSSGKKDTSNQNHKFEKSIKPFNANKHHLDQDQQSSASPLNKQPSPFSDSNLDALDLFDQAGETDEMFVADYNSPPTYIPNKKQEKLGLPALEKRFLEQVNSCDLDVFYHTMKSNGKKKAVSAVDLEESEQHRLHSTSLGKKASSASFPSSRRVLERTQSDHQLSRQEFLSQFNQLHQQQVLEQDQQIAQWIQQQGLPLQFHSAKDTNIPTTSLSRKVSRVLPLIPSLASHERNVSTAPTSTDRGERRMTTTKQTDKASQAQTPPKLAKSKSVNYTNNSKGNHKASLRVLRHQQNDPLFQMELKHQEWVHKNKKAMEKELKDNNLASLTLSKKVEQNMEVSKDSMPVSFLFQNNLGQEAIKKGLETMLSLLKKAICCRTEQVMAIWMNFVEDCRCKDREAASRVVQLNWRGKSGRLKFLKAKKQAMIMESDKAKTREASLLKRVKSALLVMRVYRVFKFRRAVLQTMSRIKAIKLLQKNWRNKALRLLNMANLTVNIREGRAAVFVQRHFRGFIGRKRFKRKKMITTQALAEHRFDTIPSTLLANFEMHGSAKRLQVWWKNLPWRIIRKQRKLRLFYVLRIQAVVRLYVARRRVLRKKYKRFAFVTITDVSASQIQRIVRGVMTRQRLDILTEPQMKRKFEKQLTSNLDEEFNANPYYAKKFVKYVHIVQKIWRGFSARRLYELKKVRRQGDKVAILQRTFVKHLAKIHKRQALIIINKWMIKYIKIRQRNKLKIAYIQKMWRSHLAKKYFVRLKKATKTLNHIFMPLLKQHVLRMQNKRNAVKAIWKAEEAIAGRLYYKLTREDGIKRQILTVSLIEDHTVLFETQAIFQFYCSYGQKDNLSRLGVNNWSKLLKECPNLLDKKLNQQITELIFTKSLTKLKDGGRDSHLLYANFITALKSLAEAKLNPQTKKYGRYEGEDARFVQLLQEYIYKAPTSIKVAKKLKEMNANGRTDAFLISLTSLIQRTYRGYRARKHFNSMKSIFIKQRQDLINFRSALMFQRVWKGFIGRRHACNQAKKIWEKYLDSDTGRAYWYNKVNGKTTWVKPKVFGSSDIGNPVKLPKSDFIYMVACSSCATNLVSKYCIDCNQAHCTDCSKMIHNKKSKRAKHDLIPTETCIQCEFQVGCRYCFTCKDDYCDTCFVDQHAKGMLQRHDYKPLIPFCELCNKRVARQFVYDDSDENQVEPSSKEVEDDKSGRLSMTSSKNKLSVSNDNATVASNESSLVPFEVKDEISLKNANLITKGKKLCDPCSLGVKHSDPTLTVEKLPYRPFKVDEYLYQKQLERERLLREEEFLRRKRELMEKRAGLQVIKIQKTWRGYWCRHVNRDFILERKKWFKQRLVDDIVRRKLSYKMKLQVGMAPKLKSDTIYETILKKYPVWSYNFIIDVVNSEWQACYDMIVQQEKYVKKRTFKYYVPPDLSNTLSLMRYEVRVYFYDKFVKTKKAEYEKAQLQYRNARSTTGINSEQKSDLQHQMRLKKREYDDAINEFEKINQKLDEYKKIKSLRWGPKAFEKRMKEIRQKGWVVDNMVAATEHASPYVAIYNLKKRNKFINRQGDDQSTVGGDCLIRQLDQVIPNQTVKSSFGSSSSKRKRRNRKANTSSSVAGFNKNKLKSKVDPLELGNYIRIENSKATYKLKWNSARPSAGRSIYLYLMRRWVLFASRLEGLDYRKPEDRVVIESRIPKWRFDNENLKKFKVDRFWTYDSIGLDAEQDSALKIYKLPRLSPPYALYYSLTRTLKASYPAQESLKMLASYYDFLSRKFKFGSNLFDEESSMHAKLGKYSDYYDKLRVETVHKFTRLPRPEDPQSFYDDFKSLQVTLRRIMKKSKQSMAHKREALKEKSKRDKDPLTIWIQSKRQLEVIVKYRVGSTEEVVGYIKVDLDIPIFLSRSIIHRYLWKELNTKYHGSSFLFTVDEDSTLAVEKEQIAILDSIIRQKLNVKTRQAEYIVVLEQDIENEKSDIELWDWDIEEAKLEQYASIKEKPKVDNEIAAMAAAAAEGEGEGGGDDFNNPDKFKNVNEQTLRQKAELAIYYEELNREAEEREAEEKFKRERAANDG